MKENKFIEIVSYLWTHRRSLLNSEFDYPDYGGLKDKMGSCSPEAVDAIQNIWSDFCNNKFAHKIQLAVAYLNELNRLGEHIE